MTVLLLTEYICNIWFLDTGRWVLAPGIVHNSVPLKGEKKVPYTWLGSEFYKLQPIHILGCFSADWKLLNN